MAGGGITKDATLRVGIEGTEDIAGAAERALGPWERATKRISSTLGTFGSGVAGMFREMASDIARVSTALGTLDLAGSVGKFVSYRNEIARQAVATGTHLDQLRERYKALGDRTELPDESIARFSSALRQTTYDSRDSSKAVKSLADEALVTGRSLEQMGPIGETLHDYLGASFDDIRDYLARIRTVADSLGTSGGAAALQDQIAHLGGTLSQVSIKGKADAEQLIATVGELGRGLPAREQERVQQRVLGRLLANPEGLRHQLGIRYEQFYDEQGHIRDLPGLIGRVQRNLVQRYGLRVREVVSEQQNFGPEGAAAFFAFAPEAARRAQAQKLSREAEQKATEFRQSEAGQDIAQRNRLEQNKRDDAGGLLAKVQSTLAGVLPENPFLQFIAAQGLIKMGGWGIGKLLGTGGGGVAARGLIGRGIAGYGGSLAAGSPLAIGSAAIGASFLNFWAAAKVLEPLNRAMPQIRDETEAQLRAQRAGRVGAIVRAAERSTANPTPEEFKRQLGPRLIAEIERDPALQAITQGIATGSVPASVGQQAPDLVQALRQALKDSPLEVTIHIEDDSSSPHQFVTLNKGAVQ